PTAAPADRRGGESALIRSWRSDVAARSPRWERPRRSRGRRPTTCRPCWPCRWRETRAFPCRRCSRLSPARSWWPRSSGRTVGGPLSTWLDAQIGWRGACFTWAALHVIVGLPLNALLPRPLAHEAPSDPAARAASTDAMDEASQLRATVILSFVFATTLFIA